MQVPYCTELCWRKKTTALLMCLPIRGHLSFHSQIPSKKKANYKQELSGITDVVKIHALCSLKERKENLPEPISFLFRCSFVVKFIDCFFFS